MHPDVAIYARRPLALEQVHGLHSAILLEGVWPTRGVPNAEPSPGWRSLDAELGPEFAWLDERAADLVEGLSAGCGTTLTERPPRGDLCEEAAPAYLNALGLRYYVLKLLRVAAYFTEVRPLVLDANVRLTATRHVDEDYAELIGQLCLASGARLEVQWHNGAAPARPPAPPNSLVRRLLGAIDGWLAGEGRQARHRARGPRVVLCGNPRLLDPVRAALVAAGAQVWWLNDRYALRSLGRGRLGGAPQLCCDGSIGRENLLALRLPKRLDFRGIDLSRAVGLWLARRLATDGARQTRWLEQIDAHFARVQPDVLLLDEDATPLKRAAVSVARRHGASSAVLQHGAPCARFGFAPLAADRIFVWGDSSRDQLLRWNVAPECIVVTGSPLHDRLRQSMAARSPSSDRDEAHSPRILLLGTMPPRDERPDLVSMQFTTAAYAEMLRMALAAVAQRPGARLSIKLHPRATSDSILDAILAEYSHLDVRILRDGHAEQYLADADCVLSLISSAGIDATLSGVPVIQILPCGAIDLLPSADWGALDNAQTEAELDALLDRALSASRCAPVKVSARVFGDFREPAVDRIVREALAQTTSQARPESQSLATSR